VRWPRLIPEQRLRRRLASVPFGVQEVHCMAELLQPEGYVLFGDSNSRFVVGIAGEGSPPADIRNRFNRFSFEFLPDAKLVSDDGTTTKLDTSDFATKDALWLLIENPAVPVGVVPANALASCGIVANGKIYVRQDTMDEALKRVLSDHLHGEIQKGELLPNEANERLAKISL
jgi:hypothetical protein